MPYFVGDATRSSLQRTLRRCLDVFGCILKIAPTKRIHPDVELKTYYRETVTFGFASSPYLAIRTLHQLTEYEGNNFSLAKDILKNEIYVDDVLSGAYDIDTTIEKRRQVNVLPKAGGFILMKWLSNCVDVLQGVSEDCKEKASSYEFTQEPVHRALGILWQPVSDSFKFQVQIPKGSGLPTKRSVFSEIARLFDPLRWLAPVSITAKIFMQSLWKFKIDWDQPLPDDHIVIWRKYRNELPELSLLSIPRWLGCSSDASGCELRGFQDASEKAIGAVVYLRILLPSDKIRVSLITAKTKIARLKETSLPRLELCLAVLLVCLVVHVRSVLNLPTVVSSHLWSDSANTLNREERTIVHFATVALDPPWSMLSRYSTLTKLLRITALCLRFIDRWRKRSTDLPPYKLTPAGLNRVRSRLVGYEQRRHFSDDLRLLRKQLPFTTKCSLLRFLPFLDSDGLLRLGGHLKHAVMDFDERCPYILPKDSILTTLIVRHGHQAMLHGGTQLTLSYQRRQYWIITGHCVVKKVLSRCVARARHRATTCTPFMGQLPTHRITRPSRSFAVSGLDYAGPIWIRTTKGSGHKAYKGYIVVFVCFATRAVHLEACSDYTADGFIAAYKHFVARRGISTFLLSDCGTENFSMMPLLSHRPLAAILLIPELHGVSILQPPRTLEDFRKQLFVL